MKRGGISRREFLKGSGSLTLALSLNTLHFKTSKGVEGQEGLTRYLYQGWEDVYRKKWQWDKVVKGTHLVSCFHPCSFNVYVKDGIVWREEQVADNPVIEPGVPDMNPWGCQKGACHSSVMYGPERIKYPLKRVGERGEGKWKRVSWDEALAEIADAIIDAIKEAGPDSIILEAGTNGAGYVNGGYGPGGRFMLDLGGVFLDPAGLLHNDYPVGLYETFGKHNLMSSVDDWFHAGLILIWHMNPAYTRIPDYHYITEARYKGAEIISIAPDYKSLQNDQSGHQRLSIHSCHVVHSLMLRTQRGVPFLFVNPEDAKKKGIKEHDEVRVFNDCESFKVHAKLSPSVKPGQVIIYHAWEPYQFRDHKSPDIVIPGMVKWLHLAGGYGHLKYRSLHWYPRQQSRAIPVDLEKI